MNALCVALLWPVKIAAEVCLGFVYVHSFHAFVHRESSESAGC